MRLGDPLDPIVLPPLPAAPSASALLAPVASTSIGSMTPWLIGIGALAIFAVGVAASGPLKRAKSRARKSATAPVSPLRMLAFVTLAGGAMYLVGRTSAA